MFLESARVSKGSPGLEVPLLLTSPLEALMALSLLGGTRWFWKPLD
jgi:hypothetical protein